MVDLFLVRHVIGHVLDPLPDADQGGGSDNEKSLHLKRGWDVKLCAAEDAHFRAGMFDNEPVLPTPWPLSSPLAEAPHRLWPDFLLSPGFGGAMAVLAAIVAASAAVHVARKNARSQELDRLQRERQHRELIHDSVQVRREEFRVGAVGRCWDRLVWLIGAATGVPSTGSAPVPTSLSIGPELADELLRMLEHDAVYLGDYTLARAVNMYLMQFGMVLLQQPAPQANVAAADAAQG